MIDDCYCIEKVVSFHFPQRMITIQKDGINFELSNNDHTAKVINSPGAHGDIYIPRSIKHQSIRYIITQINICSFKNNQTIKTIRFSDNSELRSIDKGAFYNSSLQSITIPSHVTYIGEHAFFLCYNLKTIKFTENCELHSIDKDVFTRSSIESISIPSSVEELKEGWCCGTPKLTCLTVSQKNEYFSYADKERKMIAKKSDLTKNIYDVLVFVARDVKHVVIPATITQINPFAFDECQHLKTIDFCEDSKLTSIEKYSFLHSTIECLSVPSKVVELKEGWCCGTSKLNKVVISPLNKRFVFYDNKLILGKSTENLNAFDILVFARRDIKEAIIPAPVKRINSFAFDECFNLKTVEFSKNSELLSIDEGAFSCSSLEKITIPPSVKYIGVEAFSECKHLKSIEFSEGSQLLTIDSKAFIGSSLETLFIPPSVIELKEDWCSCTSKLTHLYLSPHNCHFSYIDDDKKMIAFKSGKDENFDVLTFASRDIEKVVIPSFIRKIGSFSFSRCLNLKMVDFSENSELLSIDERAFSGSSLKKILIPNHVAKIGDFAFCGCNNLQTVLFPDNSELSLINEGTFSWSSLKRIIIPRNVNKICNAAFISCKMLESIEFLGDDLYIGQKCFDNCQNLIVVSLPNAKSISISILAISSLTKNFTLFINAGTKMCSFSPISK